MLTTEITPKCFLLENRLTPTLLYRRHPWYNVIVICFTDVENNGIKNVAKLLSFTHTKLPTHTMNMQILQMAVGLFVQCLGISHLLESYLPTFMFLVSNVSFHFYSLWTSLPENRSVAVWPPATGIPLCVCVCFY